jgi:uncharacterized protein YxjI
MKDLNYPIHFTFNVTTLSNDFTAKDASGRTVAYVRQKMFKLKEAINIYDNTNKTNLTHTIAADKWIDFSAAYSFKDAQGKELGKIARKGWASIWKAHYELIDQHQKLQYHIREDNALGKSLRFSFRSNTYTRWFNRLFIQSKLYSKRFERSSCMSIKKGTFFLRKKI